MRPSLIAMATMCVGLGSGMPAAADPTVLELYTSQGCSSCPPADAMLEALADRDDVIALSLHVDYWDYLGWVDDLADPAFSKRQNDLTRAAGSRTVYTPQMIIGGMDHVIGSRPMQVMEQLERHAAAPDAIDVEISRTANTLRVNATVLSGEPDDAVVQLVRYHPEVVRDIRRGENAGKTIAYANVVYEWRELTSWSMNGPLAIETTIQGPEPAVVIIQAGSDGPVLGAAILRD